MVTRRLFASLAAILLAAPLYAADPLAPPDDATAPDPSASSVFVHRDQGNGAGQAGTGTVIAAEGGKCLVLTNAHVVEDGSRPLSVRKAGKSYPAEFVASSKVAHTGPGSIHVEKPDLALLVIEADLPAVAIAAEEPAPGARVRQWGFGGRPWDAGPSYKTGTVTPNRFAEKHLTGTLATQSGDSGSGLFNDAGELCGVTWGGGGGVLAVTVTQVHVYVATHATRKKQFPRLCAALQKITGRGEPKEPAAPKTPAEPPAAKTDPKKPSEKKPAEPKSGEKPLYPAPPGAGWQWDANRKLWWRWSTAPSGGCPSGRCPAR